MNELVDRALGTVPTVDYPVCEEFASLLAFGYYLLAKVSSTTSSWRASLDFVNPVNLVDATLYFEEFYQVHSLSPYFQCSKASVSPRS